MIKPSDATAAEGPQDALAELAGLPPEELSRTIGRLRREARDAIEQMIDLLDRTDPYFDELEPTVDEEPIDDLEEEPDHASTEMEDRYPDLQKPTDRWTLGREGPEDDLEPSLGSINPTDGPQPFWAVGLSDDTESEHNGAEPDEGSEHSLGSLNLIDQRRWAEGDGHDLEKGTTRRFNRKANARPAHHKLRRVDGSVFTASKVR
jgi:hypothetical protein